MINKIIQTQLLMTIIKKITYNTKIIKKYINEQVL